MSAIDPKSLKINNQKRELQYNIKWIDDRVLILSEQCLDEQSKKYPSHPYIVSLNKVIQDLLSIKSYIKLENII